MEILGVEGAAFRWGGGGSGAKGSFSFLFLPSPPPPLPSHLSSHPTSLFAIGDLDGYVRERVGTGMARMGTGNPV